MSIEPLLAAPLAVKLHVATVVPAFFVGTWLIFLSQKGSPFHRLAGKIYLSLMVLTSVAALFIQSFSGWSVSAGPFKVGLIHLFIPLTVHGVSGTLRALRAGDIAGHRGSMKGVYFGGLIIAGMLAFAPGRVMYRMFFG